MQCQSCGSPVRGKFCGSCGTPVASSSEPAPIPEVSAEPRPPTTSSAGEDPRQKWGTWLLVAAGAMAIALVGVVIFRKVQPSSINLTQLAGVSGTFSCQSSDGGADAPAGELTVGEGGDWSLRGADGSPMASGSVEVDGQQVTVQVTDRDGEMSEIQVSGLDGIRLDTSTPVDIETDYGSAHVDVQNRTVTWRDDGGQVMKCGSEL